MDDVQVEVGARIGGIFEDFGRGDARIGGLFSPLGLSGGSILLGLKVIAVAERASGSGVRRSCCCCGRLIGHSNFSNLSRL